MVVAAVVLVLVVVVSVDGVDVAADDVVALFLLCQSSPWAPVGVIGALFLQANPNTSF